MPTPGSLISLSNELNGLIEFFEKLFDLGEKGVHRLGRRRAGKAAGTLHGLHFAPGGFRRPLENIAGGRGSTADFDALSVFRGDTAQEVRQGVAALGAYQGVVLAQCGATAAQKLEELLHGNAGKFEIIYKIRALVDMARGGHASNADLQAQATKILEMIAEFNATLNELHDTIFPPSGAPA